MASRPFVCPGNETGEPKIGAVYYYKHSNIWAFKKDGVEVITVGGKYLDTEKAKAACARGSKVVVQANIECLSSLSHDEEKTLAQELVREEMVKGQSLDFCKEMAATASFSEHPCN